MTEPTFPRVTVIVPCRNEARYIRACLDSILATAYPPDRLEVLVVDGQSSDGTANIVREYAAQHSLVRLLDNPRRVVPTALNLGIQAASVVMNAAGTSWRTVMMRPAFRAASGLNAPYW